MSDLSNRPQTGLQIRDIHKSFQLGPSEVEVLQGASLELDSFGSMVLTGPSGSGKSTLLHIVGTLDTPSSGTVEIDGIRASDLQGKELAHFRNRTIGFVFQESYLLPQYTVLDNVLLPSLAFPTPVSTARTWAEELLERSGLSHRLHHRPAELSGGERQRVAVARALINRPRLLLCDEPTGSLDTTTAAAIAELLFELHEQEQNMLVVVTHSPELAQRFDRRIELREGRCFES